MGALSAVFATDGAPVPAGRLERLHEASAYRGTEGARLGTPAFLGLAHRAGPAAPTAGHLFRHPEAPLHVALCGRLDHAGELRRSLGGDAPPPEAGPAALVAAAWLRSGTAAVRALEGDFAFVLHDGRTAPAGGAGRLVCACDFMALRPLFWSFDGRVLLVASEVKQLLAAGVSREPCEEAIARYLAHTEHLVGGPRTFHRDVRRLEPGHLLVVEGGRVRDETWWRLDPARELDPAPAARVERVREAMREAVRIRTPETGPWACALTGGFDSSSVAALLRETLAARGLDAPIESFSFDFGTEEADEADVIRGVAAEVGANHHHVYVQDENAFETLPEITRAVDGPSFDLGLLMLWRKKQRTVERGVAVTLSGLGGDELFMGQVHYFADLLRRGRLLALRREIGAYHPVNPTTMECTSRARLLIDFGALPLVPRRAKWWVREHVLGHRVHPPWIRDDLAARTGLDALIREPSPRVFRDAYRQRAWEVFHHEIRSGVLPMHAALGAPLRLETRFPLLDRRLVEMLFAAPRTDKLALGQGRILQRRAMEGILPKIVLERHVKKNFNHVLARQQRPHFERELDRLFAGGPLRSEPFVDWDHLRAHRRAYLDSGFGGWYALYNAIGVETWLRALERDDAGS